MFSKKRPSANPGPRICLKCMLVINDDIAGSLCPDCGATTYPQGYCPVCEDFIRLPVAELCPKHDVELEDGVPSSIHSIAPGEPVDWVTVGVLPDSLAAAAPRIRLEAEGIPHVPGRRADGQRRDVSAGDRRRQAPSPRATKRPRHASSCRKAGRCPAMRRPISKTFSKHHQRPG